MDNPIVHGRKDIAYHQNLYAQGQALLPANPAGEIELTDADLEAIYGGQSGSEGGHPVSGQPTGNLNRLLNDLPISGLPLNLNTI